MTLLFSLLALAGKLPDYLPKDWPDHAPIPTREEWEQALKEDEIARKILNPDVHTRDARTPRRMK